MTWQPLRNLIQRHTDIPRPLRLCEVLNTDEWSATGPSFVQIQVGGDSRRAILRDSPEPAVGSALQCVRMSADAAALYLCLPLPIGCPGQLYVSAQVLGGGAWDVLRCDLAAGNVWQYRSASPVGGSYPRRPMHSYLGTRLFTWGSSTDLATPGPLYYSDDAGLTWTSCGISVSNMAMEMKYGLAFAVGGATLYQSADQGATWAAVDGPPGGTYYAVATNTSALNDLVGVLTDSGAYGCGASSFGGVGAWVTPGYGTPGGAGAWVTIPATGQPEWFTGGTVYKYDAVPASVIGTLAGGDDSPGRSFGGGGIYHAATGDGTVYGNAQYGYAQVIYDPATDHPTALTGIGANDAFLVSGSSTPYLHDYDRLCLAIALDDATPGTPKLLARDPDPSTRPWAVASSRMVADLGAEYLISVQGLTTLERWTGAVAV
jgi:hypothetical protein